MFSSTEISKFAPKERKEYYKDMTTKKDIANQIAFARNKGLEEGVKEGMKESYEKVAKKMLEDGISIPVICKYTDLSQQQVESLK